jgi:hypothetical protein
VFLDSLISNIENVALLILLIKNDSDVFAGVFIIEISNPFMIVIIILFSVPEV